MGFSSGRVGMEMDGWFLSPLRFIEIQREFGPTLVDCSKTIEKLRATKSAQELAYIRQACRAVDISMKGISENDLARVIFGDLIDNGCEYLAIDPFIASGLRASIMHLPW